MLSNCKGIHVGIILSEADQQDSMRLSKFMKLDWIFNSEIALYMWKTDFKRQKETNIKLK